MKRAAMLKFNIQAITLGDLNISNTEAQDTMTAIGELVKGFVEDYFERKFDVSVDLTSMDLVSIDSPIVPGTGVIQ